MTRWGGDRPGPFGSGLVGCEHPLNTRAGSVAVSFPSCDFGDEADLCGDTPVEALAAQDADFDLHHVEPAGVLGRVLELQPAQHAARFGGRKGLVQRAGRVCRQIVQDDGDAFRFREVAITELAHAGGEVHGGAAVGDFDPAPRAMHVEENEQVGRSVALVFAVVALELSRHGRDRLARLADELDRALVEADHWTLRIGWFGVEVEYVLHAGDILAVHLRDAPHVLAPRLEVVLGQAPAYGLAGEAAVLGEPDEFILQQLHGPAGATLRRVRTGGGDEQSFFLARELAVGSRARLLAERRLKVGEHEAALGPVHGRPTNADTGGDRLVAGAGIGGEQNLRPLELARLLLATAQKRPEFGALGMAELHPVAYIHPRLLGSRHGRTAESDGRRESACKNFHAQAGPNIWRSSTPIRGCIAGHRPKPTWSSTSASAHLRCIR